MIGLEIDVPVLQPRAPRKVRPRLRIDIWHNLLWSRYKGQVFSRVYERAQQEGIDVRFIQIAEADTDRVDLAPIDLRWHDYPFDLLFRGSLAHVSRWRLFREAALRIWRSDADVIVLAGYERPEYWLQAFIGFMRGKKIAVFCDSTIYDRAQHPLRGVFKRIIFRACHGIFCYGQRSGEYVRSFGATADKVFIRCQAAALFHHYDVADIVRRKAKPDGQDGLTYLYVGRLAPEKCLDDLLKAFAKLLEQQQSARLVLVGAGPEKAALVDLAGALGVSRAVTFAGACHDEALVAHYLAASCLVLPSRSEPWGLVVNEALSCGCAVVVSDRCGCTPELVADRRTGFSFRCGDIDDLAAKMARIPELVAARWQSAIRCVEHVAPYNANAAAQNILSGCRVIAGVRYEAGV